MDTARPCTDQERDLDDSGCVQDESLSSKVISQCEEQRVHLLDLPDDVLLHILKYCDACDLKALGFTCPRLGALVLDRSFWRRVDARAMPCGVARLRWLLDKALNEATTELLLRGYALESRGCQGHIEYKRGDLPGSPKYAPYVVPRNDSDNSKSSDPLNNENGTKYPPYPVRQPAQLYIRASTSRRLPRQCGRPYWPGRAEVTPLSLQLSPSRSLLCPGARLSCSRTSLRLLAERCPKLTILNLEYCVLDARMAGLAHFPKTLKELSLKGTKCYNLTTDRTFLFRINDYLPVLESLDVSECDWMEPAALLPLSKMLKLRLLFARDCLRLSEFVAYASLAAVRGFRALEVVDLSGSPLSDSEASSFSWLPRLRSLALSPPRAPRAVPAHAHYSGEPFAETSGLSDWEIQEPPYYKSDSERLEDPDEPEIDPEPAVAPVRNEGTQVFTITFDRENGPRVENFVVPPGMLHEALPSNCNLRPQEPQSGLKPLKAEVINEVLESISQSDGCNMEPVNGVDDAYDCEDTCEVKENKVYKVSKNASEILFDVRNYEFDVDDSDSNDGVYAVNDISNAFDCANEPVAGPSRQCLQLKSEGSWQRERNAGEGSGQNERDTSENNNSKNEGSAKRELHNNDDRGESSAQNACETNNKNNLEVNNAISDSKSETLNKVEANDAINKVLNETENIVQNIRQNVDVDSDTEAGPSNGNIQGVKRSAESDDDESTSKRQKGEIQKSVRFRRNLHPEVVLRDPNRPNVEIVDMPYWNERNQVPNNFFVPNENDRAVRVSPYGSLVFAPPPRRVASSSLISDSTITSFGVSDVRNYVHFGQDGILFGGQGNSYSKPTITQLRRLVCTGYSRITDVSLNHLLYAAPFLEYVDFSESNVSKQCVENFKALRPNCEVVYSKFEDK